MATYQDCINFWSVLLEQAAQDSGDPNYTPGPDFLAAVPLAIATAENRIYKKLVFLNTRQTVTSLTTTAGRRTLDISALNPICLAVEGVALMMPSGTPFYTGTRWQFDPATLDTIDSIWPNESQTLQPSSSDWRGFAMKDDKTIVLAPTPDLVYPVELVGQFQPVPLSPSNATTYLTANYIDAFIAAGMVYWAGHQRDYGMQSDDPKLAVSWEGQYQVAERLMIAEENRRRGLAPGDGSAARQTASPQLAQSAQA